MYICRRRYVTSSRVILMYFPNMDVDLQTWAHTWAHIQHTQKEKTYKYRMGGECAVMVFPVIVTLMFVPYCCTSEFKWVLATAKDWSPQGRSDTSTRDVCPLPWTSHEWWSNVGVATDWFLLPVLVQIYVCGFCPKPCSLVSEGLLSLKSWVASPTAVRLLTCFYVS